MLILPQGRRDELPCLPHLAQRGETGDSDSEQPHRSFPINKPGKQYVEDRQHLLRQLEVLLAATGPGHQLERTPTHLKRQRPAGEAQFGQAVLHLLSHPSSH